MAVSTPDEHLQGAFETICGEFTQMNAAGGLVRNDKGEYLLIFRNGLWDLPKGKQEEGEDISICAQREVMEECGISNLHMGELLCITHHTYHLGDKFILKHTYWYNMECNGADVELTPQLEEGIQRCEWVAKEDIAPYLDNTYPSIREVFESI